MKNKNLEKIIRDYLDGKYSKEGEELFNKWYASFEDDYNSINDLNDEAKTKIKEEIFQRISGQTYSEVSIPHAVRSPMPMIYKIAASVAVVLAVLSLYFFYFHQLGSHAEWHTGNAEIKNITLPDGSKVVLNANSTLSYSRGRHDAGREVHLSGEAFFSVVHTSDSRNFTVRTPQLSVNVLGTEFNVFDRRNESNVVLTNGKVDLLISSVNEIEKVTMQPGELVKYISGQNEIIKESVDPKIYTAWKNKEIILENTSISEIALTLQDFYGFEIVIADEQLKDMKITSTEKLSMSDTEVILEAISEILDINVTRIDDKIYFTR